MSTIREKNKNKNQQQQEIQANLNFKLNISKPNRRIKIKESTERQKATDKSDKSVRAIVN
jgi:hypothetical protein